MDSVTDYDLIILGAGAAGMMAAIAAKAAGGGALRVAVFEKNPQPGIKVLVCGGGRCNFTNAGTVEFLIEQFGRNGRFLTPALRHLSNDGLRELFAAWGVPSHEEHDGKIYPDSNQARSVVDALVNRMRALGVDIHCGAGAAAQGVTRGAEGGFTLTTVDGRVFASRLMLLAVGGMSYQRMGTTGDGYRIAESLGHSVVTPRPAIVGLLCKEEWPRELKGLAVRGVEVRVEVSGPLPRLATGKPTPSVNDLLFTHFGLSGPAILNPSEIVAELLEKMPSVVLRLDFARQVSHEGLGAMLRGWQQTAGRKLVRKMLSAGVPEVMVNATSPDQTGAAPEMAAAGEVGDGVRIPARLAEKLLALCGVPSELTCAQLTSAQMHHLVERLKGTRVTIHATRGFKEAMVTAGGISLREVDPQTMASKVVPGLYLAGEVLDLTGPSGGYNLQLAFSTGHLAGTAAGRGLES